MPKGGRTVDRLRGTEEGDLGPPTSRSKRQKKSDEEIQQDLFRSATHTATPAAPAVEQDAAAPTAASAASIGTEAEPATAAEVPPTAAPDLEIVEEPAAAQTWQQQWQVTPTAVTAWQQ